MGMPWSFPTKTHLFTHVRHLSVTGCLIASATSFSPLAGAQEKKEKNWHLGAEVVTDLPVDVALRISSEAPYRLRLSTSFGLLPGPYVQLINAVIVEAGGYNEATADIIEAALSTSFVWRTQLGWRFVPDWGFYADVGYGLVTLGGGLSGAELLGIATGSAPPVNDQTREFDVTSTLHLLVIEAGYEWTLLDDHLVIRAAAGFAGALGASTSVEPQFTPLVPFAINAYTDATATYLDDLYTSYVFTPTVTIGAGYRFF